VAAALFEEVEGEGVKAWGKGDGAGLGLEAVEAIVVDDELAADVEVAAVVGVGPEGVGRGLGDVDVAGVAEAEVVFVVAGLAVEGGDMAPGGRASFWSSRELVPVAFEVLEVERPWSWPWRVTGGSGSTLVSVRRAMGLMGALGAEGLGGDGGGLADP